jgi:predicted NUDIX family NTP pyrophosphohydrolase
MPQESAGILLYRTRADGVDVLLAHPGGPFWHSRDDGAWSIPKGGPMEGEFDPATLNSLMFRMEWPPRSGRFSEFPEVDRAQWFALPEAYPKMLESQRPLLDRLDTLLNAGPLI